MINDYILPDSNHCALLTIDVQRDTTIKDAPLEIKGTLKSVPYIQRLAKAFRNHHRPIILVVRLYRTDGSNVDLCRRFVVENGKEILVPGSDGSELINELKPDSNVKLDSNLLLSGGLQQIGPLEWILYKPRWGAFYDTPLEKHLHSIDVNTVVVCGCNFPNCPRTTIYEASERDFKIVVVKDATSAIYDIGVSELENIGVRVMNTDQCKQWLKCEVASVT
jgi:nicotinamidase-related amidase